MQDLRPRFSESRWEDFKQDVYYLQSISNPQKLHNLLIDAGFNPPPLTSPHEQYQLLS